jgi:drug/metabolite transporter (DMT)-like permease
MVSIVLALAASLSWGVSDFLGGLTSRRLSIIAVLLISQAVGLIMVVPAILMSDQPPVDGPARVSAIAGSIAGLIGIAALYRAIAIGMASIAAPISATGAAIPVVVGYLRGEPTSAWQEVGIALAIGGVVLSAWTAGDPRHSNRARRLISAGSGFALLAAAGFGCFFVLLHDASTYSVLWATFVQRLTSVGILLVVTLVLRPSLAVGWRRAPRLLAIGALDQGANLLYGFASTVGLVSLAAVLASLFPVVTVILARAILHERISRTQQTGVACALAGVALIAGG